MRLIWGLRDGRTGLYDGSIVVLRGSYGVR